MGRVVSRSQCQWGEILAYEISLWRQREAHCFWGLSPCIAGRCTSKREAAKKLLASGTDPGETKKAEKLAQKMAMENSFESMAREWHKNKADHWVIAKKLSIPLKKISAGIYWP